MAAAYLGQIHSIHRFSGDNKHHCFNLNYPVNYSQEVTVENGPLFWFFVVQTMFWTTHFLDTFQEKVFIEHIAAYRWEVALHLFITCWWRQQPLSIYGPFVSLTVENRQHKYIVLWEITDQF